MKKNIKIKTGQISKKILMYLFITGAICIAVSSPRFISRVGQTIFKQKLYQKRKLLDAFNYLKRQELIKIKKGNSDVRVSLTLKGKQRANKYQIHDVIIGSPQNWDRKWRVIVFDVPQEQRTKRNVFQKKLKELGFYPLQKSVWLHPSECKEKIQLLKSFFGLKRGEVRTIVAQEIENDSSIKKFFAL
jgi:DNA-binding transcriptional regulator PaaX